MAFSLQHSFHYRGAQALRFDAHISEH